MESSFESCRTRLPSSTSVYDNGLLIGTQTVNVLEVDVRTNGGSVDVTVTGSDQKPAAGKTVVLVPAASRRQNPSLYKVASTDAQGRMSFGNLAPGQYKLFAWESVETDAWVNPDFMANYEQYGLGLSVGSNEKISGQVRAIR